MPPAKPAITHGQLPGNGQSYRLGRTVVDAKKQEITAIPKLLENHQVSGGWHIDRHGMSDRDCKKRSLMKVRNLLLGCEAEITTLTRESKAPFFLVILR